MNGKVLNNLYRIFKIRPRVFTEVFSIGNILPLIKIVLGISNRRDKKRILRVLNRSIFKKHNTRKVSICHQDFELYQEGCTDVPEVYRFRNLPEYIEKEVGFVGSTESQTLDDDLTSYLLVSFEMLSESDEVMRLINSAMGMAYTEWQLIINCQSEVASSLEEGYDFDRIVFWTGAKGDSLNDQIRKSNAKVVVLLGRKTYLMPHTLALFNQYRKCYPLSKVFYSDHIVRDNQGSLVACKIKPSWSIYHFIDEQMQNDVLFVRKEFGDSMNWISKSEEVGIIDDFIYRSSLHLEDIALKHISRVLYFTSTDVNMIQRKSRKLRFGDAISPPIPTSFITISIIIPFRDKLHHLRKCLESLLVYTEYPNTEILLVDNDSTDPEIPGYLRVLSEEHSFIRVLHFGGSFNYAAINNYAVERATGEYVLFLNNDIEINQKAWLKKMYGYIVQEHVSVVGTRLLYPDGSIQHDGVYLSYIDRYYQHPVADHYNNGKLLTDDDLFLPYGVKHVKAVTGACLLIRRSLFLGLGGFDEEHLGISFNDVDLCLRAKQFGVVLSLPEPALVHHESVSRGQLDTEEKRSREQKEFDHLYSKYRHVFY